RMCSGGKYLFVARANHLRAVRANDQRLHLSQPMAPLSAHAQSLGGNMLKINQRLAVPVSGDGRKTLVIRLSIAVSTQAERIVVPAFVQSQGSSDNMRVIDLHHRPILPSFVEIAGAAEDSSRAAKFVANGCVHGSMLCIRRDVHAALNSRRNNDVPVGVEQISSHLKIPRPSCGTGPEGEVWSAFIAVGRLQ